MIAENRSLAQVVNRLEKLVPIGAEQRRADYDRACTCKDCGETITASEIIEGEERLLKAGLDEGTAQALSPRCERCISVALAQDIAAIVTAELLLVALEVAARGTGRVFIAYSKDDRGNHISVTTNNAVVKEMRNRREPAEPGQALLYLGRIA